MLAVCLFSSFGQERLYGVPLTDLEGIKKVSTNPEATLVAALNTWTLSVMNCEFFHAVRFGPRFSIHVHMVKAEVCYPESRV